MVKEDLKFEDIEIVKNKFYHHNIPSLATCRYWESISI